MPQSRGKHSGEEQPLPSENTQYYIRTEAEVQRLTEYSSFTSLLISDFKVHDAIICNITLSLISVTTYISVTIQVILISNKEFYG